MSYASSLVTVSAYLCGRPPSVLGELIIEFARLLGVSADDILGIDSRRAKPTAPTIDKTLARRLAQLQALPRRDRDALLRTLDAFLAKSSSRAA